MKILFFFIFFNVSIFALEIRINDKKLDIEIANTEKLRQVGLQNRKQLKSSSGMLFVFPEPVIASFWMKDTYLDLSVGFFDCNKRLIQIEKMASFKANQPLKIYQSKKPIKYALEVNMGWFEQNNVSVGDRLIFN